MLGFLYCMLLLPQVVVAPVPGVWGDRHERRRVLAMTHALLVLVSGTTFVLVVSGHAPVLVLMTCALLVGCGNAVGFVLGRSVIAGAVDRRDLPGVVMLQSVAVNLTRTVAPAVAGLVVVSTDAGGAFLVYAMLSVLALTLLPGHRLRQPPTVPSGADTFTASLRAGVGHARDRPPTAMLLVLVLVPTVSLFCSSYLVQLPALAATVTPREGAFVVLTCAVGVGSLAGIATAGLLTVTSAPVGRSRSWSSPSAPSAPRWGRCPRSGRRRSWWRSQGPCSPS